jgi:hypothetical protein
MMLPDYIQNTLDWSNMRDWKVFPANHSNKKPYITDPFGNATNKPKEIKALFKRFPNALMAVPCGPINRCSVIDIDVKNGVNGLEEFQKLKIDVSGAFIVATPSGGFHLYFNTDLEELPNSASKIGPGIDLRGAGGYVIGPDSVSKVGTYKWQGRGILPNQPFSAMPKRLLEMIRGTSYSQKRDKPNKSQVVNRLNLPIEIGQRNCEIASRIGYLLTQVSHDKAWDMIQHINHKKCKPPLDQRELERTFISILKREVRR